MIRFGCLVIAIVVDAFILVGMRDAKLIRIDVLDTFGMINVPLLALDAALTFGILRPTRRAASDRRAHSCVTNRTLRPIRETGSLRG